MHGGASKEDKEDSELSAVSDQGQICWPQGEGFDIPKNQFEEIWSQIIGFFFCFVVVFICKGIWY